MDLPWPPSNNTYYRRVGAKTLISMKGRLYRELVAKHLLALKAKPIVGPVTLTIDAYPPDKRQRDLDNILKALLDSLQHGGLFENDNQVKRIVCQIHEPLGDCGHVSVQAEPAKLPWTDALNRGAGA
jgi:crossover junction endodeoxyribonuclease RusA